MLLYNTQYGHANRASNPYELEFYQNFVFDNDLVQYSVHVPENGIPNSYERTVFLSGKERILFAVGAFFASLPLITLFIPKIQQMWTSAWTGRYITHYTLGEGNLSAPQEVARRIENLRYKTLLQNGQLAFRDAPPKVKKNYGLILVALELDPANIEYADADALTSWGGGIFNRFSSILDRGRTKTWDDSAQQAAAKVKEIFNAIAQDNALFQRLPEKVKKELQTLRVKMIRDDLIGEMYKLPLNQRPPITQVEIHFPNFVRQFELYTQDHGFTWKDDTQTEGVPAADCRRFEFPTC